MVGGNDMRDKKPELLVPAGGLDTLKVAVDYGADAVYIGGQAFGLRAKADNFSIEEMKQGVEYAHAHNAKVYVTANIFAHNYDLDGIRAYFGELKDTGVDAVLVSDPGVFTIARETMPDMELHISTQANNTNYWPMIWMTEMSFSTLTEANWDSWFSIWWKVSELSSTAMEILTLEEEMRCMGVLKSPQTAITLVRN